MGKMALLDIDPRDYDSVVLQENEILDWLHKAGAFLECNDKPSSKTPHIELTPEICTTAYFDCPRLAYYPNIIEILGRQLAGKIKKENIGKIDWIVSSAYTSITFANEVAKALGVRYINVEEDPTNSHARTMFWRRATLPRGSRILQIEDIIATRKTIDKVRQVVGEGNTEKGLEFLPVVGCFVYRPAISAEDNKEDELKVISLITKKIWTCPKNQCPLCAAGSPRYSLKGKGLGKILKISNL
jgi:orotate phosphoribosyltransferase